MSTTRLGFITQLAGSPLVRYLNRMAKTDAKSVLSRIDSRLTALAPAGKTKLSDRAASTRSGLPADAIGTIRKQVNKGRQQGFRVETIDKLASGLRTTTQWLLREEGAEFVGPEIESAQSPAGARTVPLVGYVSSGAEVKFIPLPAAELDRVAAPLGATGTTRGLEVRGDSLGEAFDRWLVFYDDERSAVIPDLIGKLCVIGLSDDRVLVRKIKRSEEVDIHWAARVIDMRQQ
jgi:hypothetical protein